MSDHKRKKVALCTLLNFWTEICIIAILLSMDLIMDKMAAIIPSDFTGYQVWGAGCSTRMNKTSRVDLVIVTEGR